MTTTHEALREAVKAMRDAHDQSLDDLGYCCRMTLLDAIARAEEALKQPDQSVFEAVHAVQSKHLGLIKVVVNFLASVEAQHDKEYPLKYTIPYGALNALREALEAHPPTYDTTKWRWVPGEPTDEMLAAADEGDRQYTLRNFGDVATVMQGPYDHWCAMLEAAPLPPGQPAEWVGLTKQERNAAIEAAGRYSRPTDVACSVEAKLREKNSRPAERIPPQA